MAPGYTLDVLLQDEEMSAVAVTGNGPPCYRVTHHFRRLKSANGITKAPSYFISTSITCCNIVYRHNITTMLQVSTIYNHHITTLQARSQYIADCYSCSLFVSVFFESVEIVPDESSKSKLKSA